MSTDLRPQQGLIAKESMPEMSAPVETKVISNAKQLKVMVPEDAPSSAKAAMKSDTITNSSLPREI